jgi:hypothetical protein
VCVCVKIAIVITIVSLTQIKMIDVN